MFDTYLKSNSQNFGSQDPFARLQRIMYLKEPVLVLCLLIVTTEVKMEEKFKYALTLKIPIKT